MYSGIHDCQNSASLFLSLQFRVSRNVSESDQLTLHLLKLDGHTVHNHSLVRVRDLLVPLIVDNVSYPNVGGRRALSIRSRLVQYDVLQG